MSVSSNHIIEINMIKELITNCDKCEKTRKGLLEVLESIIKVADTIMEINDDFLIHRDSDYSEESISSEDSDEEYFTPTPQGNYIL